MKMVRFYIVSAALLAALGSSDLAFAGPEAETLKKTISANENYLRRFKKEQAALAQATDAESVKKRDSLDKKIKNLEMENARLSGSTEKKPAAPVAVVQPAQPKAPAALAGSAIADWEKMSREAKESYIQDLVNSLKKEGRVIQRHPLFYTALMDYVFVSDSSSAAKPLKDAVIATIQKNEKAFAQSAP